MASGHGAKEEVDAQVSTLIAVGVEIWLIGALLPSPGHSEPSYPYPNTVITEDFGPRKKADSPWHGGMDFMPLPEDGGKGYPIRAVDSGIITGFSYTDRGGWMLRVASQDDPQYVYSYLHLFDNSKHWDCRQSPLEQNKKWTPLEVPGPGHTTWFLGSGSDEKGNSHCFILRTGGSLPTMGFSDAIFSLPAGQGQTIPVTNVISQDQPIAPTGNSGKRVGVHLHLALKVGNHEINPFFKIPHPSGLYRLEDKGNKFSTFVDDPLKVFFLGWLKKIDGKRVDSKLIDRVFSAAVNSQTGFDLNRVNFFLKRPDSDTEELLAQGGSAATFDFGGRPDSMKNVDRRCTFGSASSSDLYGSCRSLSKTAGYEEFTVNGGPLRDMATGWYTLKVVAQDVTEDPFHAAVERIHFFVDKKGSPCVFRSMTATVSEQTPPLSRTNTRQRLGAMSASVSDQCPPPFRGNPAVAG